MARGAVGHTRGLAGGLTSARKQRMLLSYQTILVVLIRDLPPVRWKAPARLPAARDLRVCLKGNLKVLVSRHDLSAFSRF